MNGGGKSSLFKALALAENVPVDGDLQINGKVSSLVPAGSPLFCLPTFFLINLPSFLLPSFLPSIYFIDLDVFYYALYRLYYLSAWSTSLYTTANMSHNFPFCLFGSIERGVAAVADIDTGASDLIFSSYCSALYRTALHCPDWLLCCVVLCCVVLCGIAAINSTDLWYSE
jgi:hypothetical protein